jgi:tRNA(His) guanylyltransferase
VYWEQYEKEGFNPKSGKTTRAMRQRLKVVLELPMKEGYETFIRERICSSSSATPSNDDHRPRF